MRTKTIHKTHMFAECPKGASDYYEVEFHVENKVIAVEDIQATIAKVTKRTIYQEDLTASLANRLGCKVVTYGIHSGFKTECTAEPEVYDEPSGD